MHKLKTKQFIEELEKHTDCVVMGLGATKTISKEEAEDPLSTKEVVDLSLDKLSKDTFLNMLG